MYLRAYAKINLTLDIKDKRADGYHIIDSVFQTVSLCDKVWVKKSDKLTVFCDNENINGEDNIVYKAAREFLSFCKISGGAYIKIKKAIPLLSGMGGGSSDAAAVLKALNKIYETNLSADKLAEIGAKIGADVPFFIFGKTARVGGIGEIVVPIKHLKGYNVLLIKNGDKKSTAEMYRLSDEIKEKNPLTDKCIIDIYNKDISFKYVGNDFSLVFDMSDTVNEIKKTNPLCFSLTGSGPTLFAVYETKAQAKKSLKILKQKGYNPILSKFI